jgi:hypothetical protein
MVGMGVYRTFASGLPAGASTTKLVNASANIALGVPVGTDLLLTLLIIGRIYYLAQWSPELLVSARRIYSVISIIIESGAMVIIVQFITSVLVLRNIQAQNIVLCVLAQVYVRFVCSFFLLVVCEHLNPYYFASTVHRPNVDHPPHRLGQGHRDDIPERNDHFPPIRSSDDCYRRGIQERERERSIPSLVLLWIRRRRYHPSRYQPTPLSRC